MIGEATEKIKEPRTTGQPVALSDHIMLGRQSFLINETEHDQAQCRALQYCLDSTV